MKEKRRLHTELILILLVLAIAVIFAIVWKTQQKDSNFKSQLPAELSLSTLNEKTGEECIEILKDYGLVLPEGYEKDKQLAEEAVKTIISDLNNKTLSSDVAPYSYTEMADLAEQISDIVHSAIY